MSEKEEILIGPQLKVTVETDEEADLKSGKEFVSKKIIKRP